MENQLPVNADQPTINNQKPIVSDDSKSFWLKVVFAIAILIMIGGGGWLINRIISKPNIPSSYPPTPNQAIAHLTLEATSSAVVVGDKFVIGLSTLSDQDFVNLFVIKLNFPKDLLQMEKIYLQSPEQEGVAIDWLVANWVENFFDNRAGIISLVGGIPNPGFKSPKNTKSLLAKLEFLATKEGQAIIGFDPTSAIYRNSDNANILAKPASLALEIKSSTVSALPTSTPLPQTASISATPTASLAPIKGDLNKDKQINLADLSVLLSRWGSADAEADLNQDQKINSFDFAEMIQILLQHQAIQR